jgi:hypothetical protein
MYWKYDYELEDGTVTVTGPQGPKCPNSALSARFVLGSGEGAPGEFVEVPIYASTSESVSRLRIVLDSMPELAWVEAINVNVVRDADGLSDVQTAERGQTVFTSQCAGQGKDQVCTYAVPGPTNFFESDRQHAIIDQYVSPFDRIVNDYPGTELRQLGSLVVRISDSLKVGPAGVVIALQGAQVNYRGAGIESGAFGQVPDVSHFYRAEVIAGAVYVRGSGFLRGDLDANGRAQVTDAVNLLNYLFLNGFKPSCEDAADVDDDGRIMLTDGIFLLNVLFLNGVPVDPCVQCGSDDSMDSLSCTSSSCG